MPIVGAVGILDGQIGIGCVGGDYDLVTGSIERNRLPRLVDVAEQGVAGTAIDDARAAVAEHADRSLGKLDRGDRRREDDLTGARARQGDGVERHVAAIALNDRV